MDLTNTAAVRELIAFPTSTLSGLITLLYNSHKAFKGIHDKVLLDKQADSQSNSNDGVGCTLKCSTASLPDAASVSLQCSK